MNQIQRHYRLLFPNKISFSPYSNQCPIRMTEAQPERSMVQINLSTLFTKVITSVFWSSTKHDKLQEEPRFNRFSTPYYKGYASILLICVVFISNSHFISEFVQFTRKVVLTPHSCDLMQSCQQLDDMYLPSPTRPEPFPKVAYSPNGPRKPS